MSVHPLSAKHAVDPVNEAKIELAAAHRLAVLHELEEGIDNHFTVTVPERDDRYLILPFGLHWSEARASDMIMFDESGATLEGDGIVELSAQCIHAPIHRITGTRVVLHTHQTWAVALNMLKNNRLLPASQTARAINRVSRWQAKARQLQPDVRRFQHGFPGGRRRSPLLRHGRRNSV